MQKRRAARALVLLGLYQIDVGQLKIEEALLTLFSKTANEALIDLFSPPDGSTRDIPDVQDVQDDPDLRAFVQDNVQGTWEHRQEIDDIIRERAQHWRLERMARIDRNILRMAIYEMMFRKDIPRTVSVNEAVDLAKAFGDDNSGRFVNGILGNLLAEHGEIEGKEAKKRSRSRKTKTKTAAPASQE